MARITNITLKAALTKFAGNYSLAADELGCSRQNVKQRVDGSPEIREHLAQLEERVLDAAEAVVVNSILRGNSKDAKWMLQYRGKSRGYSTRTELTGKDGADLPASGATVNVNITYRSPKS